MEDQEKIRLQLKSLHCPMNWEVPQEVELSPAKMIEKVETKLVETEEEGIFKWHKLVLTLLLCSEYYKSKQYMKALEKQKQCEAVMSISDSKGYYEKLFHDTKAALFHVLRACECHILYASGETSTLEERLKEIPKYEDMNTQSKATLLGIQSSVSMEYGHEGNQMGLKSIEKALELDPNEGEWHFLLGRCLVRLRHVEDYTSIPSDKELKAFDRAYSITANPSYLTFIGNAHREAADNVRFSTGVFMDEDYKKSYSYFKRALEKTGNCSHVLARCAFGFWKLPSEYQDPELAIECYKKALAIAPKNVMANHIAGKITYIYNRDYNKAKEYFKIAAEGGAYGAFIDLMHIAIDQEEGYDPIPHLEYMLEKFRLEPRLSQTKIHLGAAYLVLKDDLSTALRYWMDVINEYPERDTLKQYSCHFIFTKENLNVYELIINEVRLALKENKTNADDKLKFQQALQTCIEKQPELGDLVVSLPQSWKEKFSIRRKRRFTRTSRGKGRQKDFSRRSNSEEASNSNWREKGSNEGRKSQEFERSETFNSSCDSEENMLRNNWQGSGTGRRFVRNEPRNSSCDSEENKPDSDWKGRGRTSFQGKDRDFGRTESQSSSCDGEENLPEHDWRGRGRNSCETGKSLDFGKTESCNSSCDGEENMPGHEWRGRGRNSCERGKSQDFGRRELRNSSCEGEENKPGGDWRGYGRNTYGRGKSQEFGKNKPFNSNCNDKKTTPGSDWRGRGRSVEHEYRNGQFGKEDVNTNLKGNRESRSSNRIESRGDAFNSNRGRGQDARRNLNSNWRLN